MEWIKVYYAENEIDASLVKGKLESQGLQAKAVAKNFGSLIQSPYYSTPGSVPYEIFVPQNQQQQAEEILKEEK